MTTTATTLAVALALTFALSNVAPAAAPRWTPVAQPDLKQQLDAAKPLQVEDVCIPVRSVRRDSPMRVPNPDGKTYDVLAWYYKGYSGPTTVYMIDLGTGEVEKGGIPLGRQIHVCGQVLGPDGKYYMATPDRREGTELYVYDPAANELSCLRVVAQRPALIEAQPLGSLPPLRGARPDSYAAR